MTTTDSHSASGRTSEDIQSDIERTRADMDETFAALDSKLTPGQIGLEVWNLFKGGSSAGAGKLWRIAREHPMPAAVIGLGVGWLLVESSKHEDRRAGDYGSYRSGYSDDYSFGRTSYTGTDFEAETGESGGRVSAAKEKVKDVAESAKGALASAKDRVEEVADRTREQALELGQRVKYRASALKSKTKSQTHRAKIGFWQTMEENPLMVGAATLAVGVIAGLAIPSTEKEDELMGETRDRLFEEVKEAGEQALDKGKQVAEAVADKVKEEAQNQGLTPEGVAEKVKNVAKQAAQTAKEEAKHQNLTPEAAANRAKQAAEHVRETARSEVHEPEPELVKR